MGLAKTLMLESEERGWDAPDKNACADCFEDEYLKSVVEEHAVAKRCDYCGRRGKVPIAAPLSEVMGPIAKALHANFEEPGAAGLPRDSGEWVGEERITYTEDALLSLPLDCHEGVFEDVAGSFHNHAWYPCAGGFWLDIHRHIELGFSWENFVEIVKHKSRFFFMNERHEREHGELDGPLVLLHQIGHMAESLGLIQEIAAKTNLFRVRRPKPGKSYEVFDDVGPPPPTEATAGRMNPTGISYFYVALEDKTALAEVLDKPPTSGVLASFSTKVDIRVLDLTRLPRLPSIFDEHETENREAVLFLTKFIEAITTPIPRGGVENIEYVPSQVVSEYFAQVFLTEDNERLDGVIYPSAVMPGGKNLVIFPLKEFRQRYEDIVDLRSIETIEVPNWAEHHRLLGLTDRPKSPLMGSEPQPRRYQKTRR